MREINDVTGWRAAELGVPLHFGLRLIWSTAGISMAGETLLELAMTSLLESVDVGGDCDGLGGWLLQSLPGVALHCYLGVALLAICSVTSTGPYRSCATHLAKLNPILSCEFVCGLVS